MGTQLPLPHRGTGPNFRPYTLWPNGCIDQDATWYGGRPRPRRLCVRWRHSPLSQKGAEPPPQFLAHFYCNQTAGCIKMALGMEVGLSPGDFVLDGDPDRPLNFWPMFIIVIVIWLEHCTSFQVLVFYRFNFFRAKSLIVLSLFQYNH